MKNKILENLNYYPTSSLFSFIESKIRKELIKNVLKEHNIYEDKEVFKCDFYQLNSSELICQCFIENKKNSYIKDVFIKLKKELLDNNFIGKNEISYVFKLFDKAENTSEGIDFLIKKDLKKVTYKNKDYILLRKKTFNLNINNYAMGFGKHGKIDENYVFFKDKMILTTNFLKNENDYETKTIIKNAGEIKRTSSRVEKIGYMSSKYSTFENDKVKIEYKENTIKSQIVIIENKNENIKICINKREDDIILYITYNEISLEILYNNNETKQFKIHHELNKKENKGIIFHFYINQAMSIQPESCYYSTIQKVQTNSIFGHIEADIKTSDSQELFSLTNDISLNLIQNTINIYKQIDFGDYHKIKDIFLGIYQDSTKFKTDYPCSIDYFVKKMNVIFNNNIKNTVDKKLI